MKSDMSSFRDDKIMDTRTQPSIVLSDFRQPRAEAVIIATEEAQM
jgi:hypothetical protein